MVAGDVEWATLTAAEVRRYLGDDNSWSDSDIDSALRAEAQDQRNRCRFPLADAQPYYDDALTEALCRRVAHNLAVRALPLGLQASITDGAVSTNSVGGTDAEVRRLEAPYRKTPIG